MGETLPPPYRLAGLAGRLRRARPAPRYPQTSAELMAGRIPLSEDVAREARSLIETRIGLTTARNIGWPSP